MAASGYGYAVIFGVILMKMKQLMEKATFGLYAAPPAPPNKDYNAYVIDIDNRNTGTWETLEDKMIPKDSRLRELWGYEAHLLKRNGSLQTIDAPFEVVSDKTTSNLYGALSPPSSAVEKVIKLDKVPWYKTKDLPYLIIIVICLILLFLFFFGGGGR